MLPAIEATVAKLAAAPTHPREMERAARVLASLTRTLRELNRLLSEHQAATRSQADDEEVAIDEFREAFAQRIRSFVAARTGEADRDAEPNEA